MACLLLQHKHRTRLPTQYYELWQVRCIILGLESQETIPPLFQSIYSEWLSIPPADILSNKNPYVDFYSLTEDGGAVV